MLLRRLSSVSIRTQVRANSTLSAGSFLNSSQSFAINRSNNITIHSKLLSNTINATKSIYKIIQNKLIELKSSYINTSIFENTSAYSSISNNSIHDNISDSDSIYMTSTMKRRKRKMNKHKKRKLMKRLRANTKQSRQG